jgi:hypothetical protein
MYNLEKPGGKACSLFDLRLKLPNYNLSALSKKNRSILIRLNRFKPSDFNNILPLIMVFPAIATEGLMEPLPEVRILNDLFRRLVVQVFPPVSSMSKQKPEMTSSAMFYEAVSPWSLASANVFLKSAMVS